MKHKLMPIVYPFMEELQEPAKQDPCGIPPITKTRVEEREQIKEYMSTNCDPSGHVYTEAQYKEEPAKKKKGRPWKETTTPTVSNLNPNSTPLLESQASVEFVGKNLGRPRKDSTTPTVSNLNPNGTLPLESQASQGDVAKKRGRPRKVVQPVLQEYRVQLPQIIQEFVIGTDDVPKDGNCGFHVVSQQLGHLSGAVEENLTQYQYIRKKMVARL